MAKKNNIVSKLGFIATLLSVVLTFVACSDDDGVATTAMLWDTTISGRVKNCAVLLTARQGTGYVAKVESNNNWCRFTQAQVSVEGVIGAECSKSLFLYFDENFTIEDGREATITVEFTDGKFFTFVLHQQWADATIALEKKWPELPECKNAENIYYRYYTGSVNGRSNIRNYTMCYDRTKKAALWVAYPIHTLYLTGPANRNNSNFVVEPSVPVSEQPNLSRSYAGRYDRGHQIAAADRKCTQEMMNQTFYWTNMTPQQSDFNQNLWGSLEGKVRNEKCADTLYVVTGCYFDGERHSSIAETTTASGVTCPIPTHYYKLMLRTVKGNTGKAISEITNASELQAVALFIQHKNSGQTTTLEDEYFISVNELERITGFDFFPMLSDAVEEQVEEQCNINAWF